VRIFRNDGGQADFGTEIYEGSNVFSKAYVFSITGNSRKSRMAAMVGEQSDIVMFVTVYCQRFAQVNSYPDDRPLFGVDL